MRSFLLAHLLTVAIVLAGCSHPRRDLAWQTAVTPTLICPGDAVILQWDVGPLARCVTMEPSFSLSSRCFDPIQIRIESSARPPHTPFVTSQKTSDAYGVFLAKDTEYFFYASDRDDQLATYIHRIRVIPAGQTVVTAGHFQGVCASAVPAWTELRFDSSEILSPRVQPIGVCNPNGFGLRLMVYVGEQMTEVNLAPNECTPQFPTGFTRVLGTPLWPALSLAANCDTSPSVPPPDVSVEVGMACNYPER